VAFWLPLILILLALAAWRYGHDSRDGRDSNAFDPSGTTPAPRRPADRPVGPHRAHRPPRHSASPCVSGQWCGNDPAFGHPSASVPSASGDVTTDQGKNKDDRALPYSSRGWARLKFPPGA
jgi:hypothetical protein